MNADVHQANISVLTEAARQQFLARKVILANRLKTLADKPDETVCATLAALWLKAQGTPVAVQRAHTVALADLTDAQANALDALIERRLSGVPLAHITQRQQFMGLELIAGTEALIPRQETALLGTTACAKLASMVASNAERDVIVIDVCTGSGNLALALAQSTPRARVWGADLSEEAVTLAKRNAVITALEARVIFCSGDVLAPLDTPQFHGLVDLLVCNPPYISSAKVVEMPTEISQYEPRLAFDGGPLGIRILQRVIADAPRFLRQGGWLAFEVGLGQGRGVKRKLEQLPQFSNVEEIIDAHGDTRVLVARRTNAPVGARAIDAPRAADNAPPPQALDYRVVAADLVAEKSEIIALWTEGLTQSGMPDAKFKWFYEAHSSGPPQVYFLIHSSSQCRVAVAAIGGRLMRFGNEQVVSGVLVDFVAAKEHRTLFPAMHLQRELLQRGLKDHVFLFGLPNPKSLGVVHRAGYQRVGMMVRYAMVLQSASYLARYVPKRLASAVSPLVDFAYALVRGVVRIGKPQYRAEWTNTVDSRFDALWEQSAITGVMMGYRDQRFLNWRFVQCPLHKYTIFTISLSGASRLAAYAVCEIDPTDTDGTRTLAVRDFLFDQNVPLVATVLWDALARAARLQGYTTISTQFMGNADVAHTLINAGLRARESRPLYAAARADRASLLNEKHWYVTSADEEW